MRLQFFKKNIHKHTLPLQQRKGRLFYGPNQPTFWVLTILYFLVILDAKINAFNCKKCKQSELKKFLPLFCNIMGRLYLTLNINKCDVIKQNQSEVGNIDF